MGLRLVKKSVNQDDPTVYHLFYGDEHAKPGLDLTFFEYPGAAPGRAGEGMIHRVVWRVGSPAALDFWSERLAGARHRVRRARATRSLFSDPEGLEHELLVADVSRRAADRRAPRGAGRARAPGLPRARARTRRDPERSRELLEQGLGFEQQRRRLARRAATSAAASTSTTSRPPSAASRAPAPCTTSRGTRPTRTTRQWRERVAEHGAHPTPGDRPPLLQVDLLPRAERRAVRAGHPQPGLHDRRAARDARREAVDPAAARGARGRRSRRPSSRSRTRAPLSARNA